MTPATRTNSLKHTKLHHLLCISIRSSIGKALVCWQTVSQFRWFDAGGYIFPTLDNLSWTAFLFVLLLLIILSSKWKSDLRPATKTNNCKAKLPCSFIKEALQHLIIFLVYRKTRTFIDAVVNKLFTVSLQSEVWAWSVFKKRISATASSSSR